MCECVSVAQVQECLCLRAGGPGPCSLHLGRGHDADTFYPQVRSRSDVALLI